MARIEKGLADLGALWGCSCAWVAGPLPWVVWFSANASVGSAEHCEKGRQAALPYHVKRSSTWVSGKYGTFCNPCIFLVGIFKTILPLPRFGAGKGLNLSTCLQHKMDHVWSHKTSSLQCNQACITKRQLLCCLYLYCLCFSIYFRYVQSVKRESCQVPQLKRMCSSWLFFLGKSHLLACRTG